MNSQFTSIGMLNCTSKGFNCKANWEDMSCAIARDSRYNVLCTSKSCFGRSDNVLMSPLGAAVQIYRVKAGAITLGCMY